MAFMSQEKKAALAPAIKAALKKHGLKGSLSVNNHSTLVLTIKSGKIDFIGNYNAKVASQPGGFRIGSPAVDHLDVNQFWYKEHFTGKALAALNDIVPAMMAGNHDRSDSQTDYFDVGWYINIYVGKWNKPYVLEK